MSIIGHLFQASMWRKYAMEWDGPNNSWVKDILQVSRAECIARAKLNVEFARMLNAARKELGEP